MIICHCQLVNDRAIRRAATAGARSVGDVSKRCRAGHGCGGCHATIRDYLRLPNEERRGPPPAPRR